MKDSFARNALFVFASLYTFFFVGALLGFGPMQRMLEQSGAFSYLCTTTDDCSAQSERLVNIGFLATTLSVVTPIIGHCIDSYGAPAVANGMSLSAMLGTALMVVAASTQTSWLYWVCFLLLGLTTFSGSLLSVQVGLLFRGRTQVRIIMWLNALFDAGSVSYLFLWMIQDYFQTSFTIVACIYFILAVLLFVPSMYFWATATDEDDEQVTPWEKMNMVSSQEHHSETTAASAQQQDSLRYFMESKMDYSLLQESVNSRRGSLRISVRTKESLPPAVAVYGSIPENDNAKYMLVADRSAKEQLLCMPFILLTLFYAISMISCTWSLITAADFLASLGDVDGRYLKLFTLVQPASILTLPLVDVIVQHYGFGVAFQVVNLINFVYISIKLVSTSLQVQVVTFFLVAAVRCFLYATVYSYLPTLLSTDVVGRGTGFLSMVGGMSCFVNLPLNSLAQQYGFVVPNFIYLVSVLPCTLAVCYLQQVMKKEAETKEERKQVLSRSF